MTNQPSAIELEIEVPGTPEDVWRAVATGPGISSWYVPHEVEERAGGAAVARFGRLVNGGFGQGGPWDGMYDAMTDGWRMFLSNLRLHMEHFAGRNAVAALPIAVWRGSRRQAWDRLLGELGLGKSPAAGDRLELQPAGAPSLIGSVEAVDPTRLSLLLDEPSPGTALLAAEGDGDEVQVSVWTYRYGSEAEAAAEADQSGWQTWLSDRAAG